jgi:hypothetical protein
VSGRPGFRAFLRRHRRGLVILSISVGLLALSLIIACPLILRTIGGRLLEGQWGGPARVDWAWWDFGKRLYFRGARAQVPDEALPVAQASEVALHFERSLLGGDPGLLLEGTFKSGVLAWEERPFANVEEVYYENHGSKFLRICGIDGELQKDSEDAWIGAIGRIADAPGIRGDGGGTPLERIEVEDSRVSLLFPSARLPLEALNLKLHMEGPKRITVEDLRAEVCRGQVSGFGEVGWELGIGGHLQIHLLGMDVETAARVSGALAAGSSGSVSGFVDLRKPGGEGELAGAGWIEGKGVRLWEQPILARTLKVLGLTAGNTDALRKVRCHFRLDRGRIYAGALVALGRPVSLFGRGSVRLDGEDLQVKIVPRPFSKNLHKLAVVGKPTQYLLDLLNGQLLEIELKGSLSHIEVSVNPVAGITAPLKEFLELFDKDKDKDKEE